MGFQFTKKTSFADLWSEEVPSVLVDTSGSDVPLPSLTIENKPKGVQRAIMMFKYRAVVDSSGSDNNIAGDQSIVASKDGFTTEEIGINLPDGAIPVIASAKEGGDVILGDVDIKAQVPENGELLEFLWRLATSLGDSLTFQDVQIGIRFYYL